MREPSLPPEGLAALRTYIDRAWPVVDTLTPPEQLALRSAITVYERLETCIQGNIAVSGAMFSRAEVLAVKSAAEASPDGRAELEDLARILEQEITPPRSRAISGAPARDLRLQLQTGLGSTYVIDRELGGGGMAHVFVAMETALNRSVVLKVIAPEVLDGLNAARFAREVRLAARLQHPNIVPVLAAGDANGLPYFTMPFVRGESLRARLTSGAPCSVTEAVRVLRDVARALAYAHGAGIVHRDIKPENVLLSGGAAVVTDFGIAKAINRARISGQRQSVEQITLSTTGTSIGTPAYMSPEQAAIDPSLDQRADLYAWGVMAWELLAGRHPFAGKASQSALVAAHFNEVPTPLATVRFDVPPALSDLVQRCLAKDPADRPASANEVLALLDKAMGEVHGGAATTLWVKARRRATLIGVGVFAAVALVAEVALRLHEQRVRDARALGVEKSIAIVPFAAPAGDARSAYLGEGIADGVTNELKQTGLRLAGISSALLFTGKTAREAGAALKFPLVLNGRVVAGPADSLRVAVDLTRVSDGVVVWHDSLAATGIAAVQDEIARAVAVRLQLPPPDARQHVRGTTDAVAYEMYLKGLYLYRRRGAGIPEAIDALKQATARDPSFARAWAALSQALLAEPHYPNYENVRMSAVLPLARDAAERAVRLDRTLADAHVARGQVHAEAFEWPQAEGAFDRGIEVEPAAAEPWYRLGLTLLSEGRSEDAIRALKVAVERDPYYVSPKVYLGWAMVLAGSRTEGLNHQLQSLRLEASSTSLSLLAWSYAKAGMSDSAQAIAQRLLDGALRPLPGQLGLAAYALARSGAAEKARSIIARLEALPDTAWTRWAGLTFAYAGLRDSARMVGAMERAGTGDGDGLLALAPLVLAGELPGGPRVAAVLRRYRLDPGWWQTKSGTAKPVNPRRRGF
jgi:serine/threonine-protein kinase